MQLNSTCIIHIHIHIHIHISRKGGWGSAISSIVKPSAMIRSERQACKLYGEEGWGASGSVDCQPQECDREAVRKIDWRTGLSKYIYIYIYY